MKKDSGKLTIPSPSKLGFTRHGKHSHDKTFYGLWMELEQFAKLRRHSRTSGLAISAVILNSLSPIFSSTRLDAADRRWMAEKRAKGKGRAY